MIGLTRRAWLLAAGPGFAAPAAPGDDAVSPERRLAFPRDHGAHLGARIEWWYATGWLEPAPDDLLGFQLTFFRSRTGLAEDLPGRFAPRQLLFAHAALTELRRGRHRHAQRIARWSGDEAATAARASTRDTALRLGPWSLERRRDDGHYVARLAAPESGFTLQLDLAPTQPVLLQGQAGYSLKGPPPHASHYYSQPQLDVDAQLTIDGRRVRSRGRGWLDHEWSDALMPPGAAGWDWIGINLDDGGALTAFALRGADGRALHAGGSHRPRGGPVRAFEPQEVRLTALRAWTSPASGASYPVHWRIETPAGSHELHALLDAQELDSRGSTGALYWEGLSELRDPGGRRIGRGYLEMTGRSAPLRLP